MTFYANPARLQSWATAALLVDITYHRSRQQLWTSFSALLGTQTAARTFPLPAPLFNSIKSAITCRSDSMTDEKKLAFDTALQQLVGDEVAEQPVVAAVAAVAAAPPADLVPA